MNTRNLRNINDWNDISRCLKIGEILLMADKISEETLAEALEMQKARTGYIGEILLMLNAVSLEDLNDGLALQADINPRCRFNMVLR